MNGGLSFGRPSVGSSARPLGLADPALRWAGAVLHDGGTLAYLTARPAGEDANELGPASSEAMTGRLA
ncbi:hypothetical protein CG723_09160 [Streptomyces sp. CB01635]|uniref:hypothetical protein n=1 Tax=unclassified Streptomyces TaxID=2593676 RepID=UPI000C270459|nr:hypothetical protein [Streptomyces sp. CB01635]PJN11122.1 hypothetical protein CG723_09160 [Streptomyces sp. CB01635]